MDAKSFATKISAGMPMREIFALAKDHIDMPLSQIGVLLESQRHEDKVGAMSILDKQARRNSTAAPQRKALFDFYQAHANQIDTWDLVDLGAPYVLGRYLFDKPRKLLYKYAKSNKPMQRRAAMVSCLYFLRQKDLTDTFELAAILVNDPHDLVQKPVGGLLREAGKQDQQRLRLFLDEHAATMPRTALRYAIEHFDASTRAHYLSLAKR